MLTSVLGGIFGHSDSVKFIEFACELQYTVFMTDALEHAGGGFLLRKEQGVTDRGSVAQNAVGSA